MSNVARAFLLFPTILFCLIGCTDSSPDGLSGGASGATTYHSTGWRDNPQHGSDYGTDPQNCHACHGDDLDGGTSDISCDDCHHGWSGSHVDAFNADPDSCQTCHGGAISTCSDCHHSDISALECSDCHADAATFYTDSAHGNLSYGVDRTGTNTEGDCTHCHDLPAGSINDLLLFAPMNQTSQTENFCFQCHQDTGASVQIGMPQQRSYSYRAGGWAADPLDDVKEAFSSASSHNLGNILTFITGKWGYTADSNPCAACHNPHAAQRDPHTEGDRGWPVSRPNGHIASATWELWGDDDAETETMKQYSADQGGTYQAPNAASGYEPDGSATQDGSNLTDYVTFCTDCHNSTNIIYSNALGRNLYTIDWNTEKHGGGAATDGAYDDVLSPYQDNQCGAYVLACTDCHEPHGSPNIFLARQRVNNGAVTVATGDEKEWSILCLKCHDQIKHLPGSGPHDRDEYDCLDCHSGVDYTPCTDCHYHGGVF
ncbi:MAG: hypothetical protein JRE23_13705 [Deltaproteobacteria bacterium]|nr:hypothetical protein [Deltaproteobacteria bacterium]